jgi:hypothetical protein
MAQDLIPMEKPPSDELHPGLYAAIAGLVVLFVVSAFAFGGSGYADYLLVVVAGFFVIAMGIPFVIWLTWRNQTHARHGKTGSLRDWFAGECQTWQCRLTGREAATQVLLPIAAVAFGMLAIGIVLLLVEHGVV